VKLSLLRSISLKVRPQLPLVRQSSLILLCVYQQEPLVAIDKKKASSHSLAITRDARKRDMSRAAHFFLSLNS
jgi:hypothetical protein